MSHHISKITFKILLVCLSGMTLLTGYFIAISYLASVKDTETAEMMKMQGVIRTLALQLEANTFNGQEYDHDEIIAYANIKGSFEKWVYNVNSILNLDNGISVILIRNSDRNCEIIGQAGSRKLENGSKNMIRLMESPGFGPVIYNLESTQTKSHLMYAYPLSLPYTDEYSGFVLAEEDITEALGDAKEEFLIDLALALIALGVVGGLAHRSLKNILSHEEDSNRKLREYAQLAEARKENLEMLSFVLSKSENLILLTDRYGKIAWLNESYSRKNNYSHEEIKSFVGRELAEISHYPRIQEVINSVISTREKLEYEAKSYDCNNNEFWACTTVTPILDDNGEVDKLLFIDTDITRMKMAEAEIAKLANFTQENSRPLIRIHRDGHVIYSNTPGQVILQHWKARLNERITHAHLRDTISAVYESGYEKIINIEQGSRIYSLRFFPVKGMDYVNVYGEDITELKTAEKNSREKALRLEQHNLNITDSMNYARRIQEAIIPGEDFIRKHFKDSFVISKPKDIVSGDFLWLYELEPKNEYLLALADCTGHGVPGAMMSIVGHSLLNEIVETHGIRDPAAILQQLNVEVIRSLKQKTHEDTHDGMDVGIIHINVKTLNITFAGAYQSLYWMNGKLNVIKGDRQPIGGLHHDGERTFQNQYVKIHKGDCVYLASDGFADQFGGPKNKKFLSQRLVSLLETNHKYSMQAQSHLYNQTFEEWRGDAEQIDDVSVLGIKF